MALVVTTIANGATPAGLVALLLAASPGLTVVGGSEVFQGNTLQVGSYVGAKRTTVPPDAGNNPVTNPALGHGFVLDTGVVIATGRLRASNGAGATTLAGNFTSSSPTNYNDNLGVSNVAWGQPIATLVGRPNTQIHDPASLAFAFVPSGAQIQFGFWFTSFEYEEFIGLQYTDAFAILLDGVNIALLPGTSTYISINTVNHVATPTWFARGAGQWTGQTWRNIAGHGLVCDRRSGAAAGEDGLGNWLPVTITAAVTPGATHTLEFVIADVSDGVVESAAFIGAGSLGVPASALGCLLDLPSGTDSGGGTGCDAVVSPGSDSGGGSGCGVSL